MDGENNGKPYEQMDDLGKHPHGFGAHTKMDGWFISWKNPY